MSIGVEPTLIIICIMQFPVLLFCVMNARIDLYFPTMFQNGMWFVFIWGQFWPWDIVIAFVCLSVRVCVCVNHEFVRVITYHPLKLESPPANLELKFKLPWLRCILLLGLICMYRWFPIFGISAWVKYQVWHLCQTKIKPCLYMWHPQKQCRSFNVNN